MSRNNTLESRNLILEYLNIFVKLLVIVKLPNLRILECNEFISNNDDLILKVANELFNINSSLKVAQLPMLDLMNSIDVLNTGKYLKLPRILTSLPSPGETGEKNGKENKTIEYLVNKTLITAFKQRIKQFSIENGLLEINRKHYSLKIALLLTEHMDSSMGNTSLVGVDGNTRDNTKNSKNDSWRLMDLNINVSDHQKPELIKKMQSVLDKGLPEMLKELDNFSNQLLLLKLHKEPTDYVIKRELKNGLIIEFWDKTIKISKELKVFVNDVELPIDLTDLSSLLHQIVEITRIELQTHYQNLPPNIKPFVTNDGQVSFKIIDSLGNNDFLGLKIKEINARKRKDPATIINELNETMQLHYVEIVAKSIGFTCNDGVIQLPGFGSLLVQWNGEYLFSINNDPISGKEIGLECIKRPQVEAMLKYCQKTLVYNTVVKMMMPYSLKFIGKRNVNHPLVVTIAEMDFFITILDTVIVQTISHKLEFSFIEFKTKFINDAIILAQSINIIEELGDGYLYQNTAYLEFDGFKMQITGSSYHIEHEYFNEWKKLKMSVSDTKKYFALFCELKRMQSAFQSKYGHQLALEINQNEWKFKIDETHGLYLVLEDKLILCDLFAVDSSCKPIPIMVDPTSSIGINTLLASLGVCSGKGAFDRFAIPSCKRLWDLLWITVDVHLTLTFAELFYRKMGAKKVSTKPFKAMAQFEDGKMLGIMYDCKKGFSTGNMNKATQFNNQLFKKINEIEPSNRFVWNWMVQLIRIHGVNDTFLNNLMNLNGCEIAVEVPTELNHEQAFCVIEDTKEIRLMIKVAGGTECVFPLVYRYETNSLTLWKVDGSMDIENEARIKVEQALSTVDKNLKKLGAVLGQLNMSLEDIAEACN